MNLQKSTLQERSQRLVFSFRHTEGIITQLLLSTLRSGHGQFSLEISPRQPESLPLGAEAETVPCTLQRSASEPSLFKLPKHSHVHPGFADLSDPSLLHTFLANSTPVSITI